MLDFTTALSIVAYEVIMSEREHEAGKRRWNRKLREIEARERAAVEARLKAEAARGRKLAETKL